ncbi:MAG TPA: FtsX-like permease family protein, partial [Thermoanaerobaculia bacterium]|nr:FtsX-like permease family protein [Thermoanaerobaculia bacterium]
FAIPAWVFACVVFVGLVIPLLAAAWPVWKGSGVSVREALCDFGISETSFGVSALDRMLAGVSGVARPILLAIRNNFRRRARLVLTVLTLAAGGVFFMTALNVRASMIHTLDRLFGTRKYDLGVSLRADSDAGTVTRIVRGVPNVKYVEAWRISGDPYAVIAVPPSTRLLAPGVIRGRWLQPGDVDAMVINSALAAKKMPLAHVVGVVREPFAPASAYVPLRGSVTNSLRVVLANNDAASIDRAKGLIEEALAREGIRAGSISSKSDSRFGFDQHMVMIYVALIIMSALIAIVGGLGLMTTLSINVLERRRELGVLRAIGATPRTIALMLACEGVVVGVLSWLLASVAAWPLSRLVGNGLLMMVLRSGLDFDFELRGVAIWLVVCVLLGAIASVVPSWHASRQQVREALGYE